MNWKAITPSQIIWIGLGIATLALKGCADKHPILTETLYSRGLFRQFRASFDAFSAILPFPAFWIFWVLILVWLYRFVRFWKKDELGNVLWWSNAYRLLAFVGALVTIFYFSWGFNYARVPLATQVGLEITKIDSLALRRELEAATNDLIAAKTALDSTQNDTFDLKILLPEVQKLLTHWHLPQATSTPKLRVLAPDGILQRFGSTGVYWAWTGECNVDGGVHPLALPFTAAHELGHGFGWANEASCNFIAYVACVESENLMMRYSGYINYFRYVASSYKAIASTDYAAFRAKLATAIINDLDDMNVAAKRYPSWVDTSSFYEWFLKSQGVKEGIGSYSRVVEMVAAWREQGFGNVAPTEEE